MSSFACEVKSTGHAPALVCWDVVATCDGRDHRGHECSNPISPGKTQSFLIDDVRPPVTGGREVTCTATRVENVTVR